MSISDIVREIGNALDAVWSTPSHPEYHYKGKLFIDRESGMAEESVHFFEEYSNDRCVIIAEKSDGNVATYFLSSRLDVICVDVVNGSNHTRYYSGDGDKNVQNVLFEAKIEVEKYLAAITKTQAKVLNH